MANLDNFIKIEYKNKKYIVCKIPYNNVFAPVLIDYEQFNQIKTLNKKWHINDKGFVVANHRMLDDGEYVNKEIYMHDLIMKLNNNINYTNSIIHINKLGVDNRLENLIYDTDDKNITKNMRKKSRIISFPKSYDIDPEMIPTFVWFMKEDKTHGERFMVDMGDVQWKSTGSKKVSLKYKLEETKKYLRYIKQTQPELFKKYSLNGDLNETGEQLLKSFLKIVKSAGFDSINDNIEVFNNTDKYLKQNLSGLTDEEKLLLTNFDPNNRHKF